MNIPTALFVTCIVAATALAGCDGPTTQGQIARENAQGRIDVMSAGISYQQAEQAFEVGRFDRAEKNINQVIATFPDVAKYHVLKGRIHMEQSELEFAYRSFTAAIDTEPDVAEGHYFAGIVQQRWSNDAQSYVHYNRAFELEPTNTQYLLATAESMIALGQLDQAWTLLEKNKDYFEGNAALHQLQGHVALLQGDPEQAVKLYERARLLNPEDAMLLEELAWAQFDAQHYSKAVESIKSIRSHVSDARDDLDHLEAQCLAGMGRSSDARNLYVELTRQKPNDTDLWAELGLIAWDLGDYYRVAQCSNRIVQLAPNRFEGPMFKGITERHQGHLDAAIISLQKASILAHSNALPHLLLGNTMEMNGQDADAQRVYEQALLVDPDNSEAKILLARLEHERRLQAVTAEGADSMRP